LFWQSHDLGKQFADYGSTLYEDVDVDEVEDEELLPFSQAH